MPIYDNFNNVLSDAANPFDTLITQEFKNLHKQAIDALLENTALTVECTLYYLATKFEDCVNCVFDPIGGKSSNRYQSGGPMPFAHGVCPMCNGVGKRQVSNSEIIYLMPIWDSKKWYPLSQRSVSMADVAVQTMSKITTYPKLKRATEIAIDNSVTNYGIPNFVRVGDPEICGLGTSTHIITSWKRK